MREGLEHVYGKGFPVRAGNFLQYRVNALELIDNRRRKVLKKNRGNMFFPKQVPTRYKRIQQTKSRARINVLGG